MSVVKKYFTLFVLLLSFGIAKAQSDNFIEITGIVMTADSLNYVPYTFVKIVGQEKGYYANEKGVFSILVNKGDVLEYKCLGFKSQQYKIPNSWTETRYSVIQLLTQDTFYLPTAFVRPGPSKDRFDYAFKNWEIPYDRYEIARQNTDKASLAILAMQLEANGYENQTKSQNIQMQRQSWSNQQAPQNIFSPLAWADFIKAWQRGDFKKKK